MSDTEKNYPGSEKKDLKKKDGKKDKKEKGYVMFDADASDEELVVGEDLRSPSKMKKGKAFRFGPKKDILKVKEEKKEKDGKKEEKEKRKGEKKHKIKGKKKANHDITSPAVPEEIDKPVFGVSLAMALERNRSHDGIQLPALFRECIDYIEEHGLHCEGIYRISGVKSKVQHLKDLYNRGQQVYLEEHEPNIVAGVLKQFLRELPEPVLTNALIPKFEEASTIRNERRRIEAFLKLILELPQSNKLLLSWMIVHMTHVIEKQQENKMTLQNVSIVLSPTMQISHRVLNVLFSHTKQLFKDTLIKRYVPPLKPATSRWSLELPDNPHALAEELAKQESLLSQLHEELHAGEADSEKAEQIWEVQRVCTQLKRKIKLAQKNQDVMEKRKRDRDEQSKRNTVMEEGEEELKLELRDPPDMEVLRLELRKPPAEDAKSVDSSSAAAQGDNKPGDTTPTADNTQSEAKQADSKVGKSVSEAEVSTDSKLKVTLKELADQNKRSKSEERLTETRSSEDVNAEATATETVEADKDATVTEGTSEEAQTEKEKDSETQAKCKERTDDDDDNDDDGTGEVTDVVSDTKVNVADDKAPADDDVGGVVDSASKQGVVDDEVESLETESGGKSETRVGKAKLGSESSTVAVKVGSDLEVKVSAKEEEEVEEADGEEEEDRDLTEEDVKSDLIKKQTMLLQEDTTDSELGHSRESLPKLASESDEFEQSLDEILERDLAEDSDNLDEELTEELSEREDADRTVLDDEDKQDESVAMETKTPVPIETPESPPTVTPVPEQLDDAQETELNTSSEMQSEVHAESAVELEISEMSEMSEDETVTEEEFQKLLEQEYALKLEEEELLAIENELRKKIETEQCESEWLQQEIDELQYLRHDSEEETFSTSSDSSYESEDEDDLQEILQHLIKQNEALESDNSEMCSSIHKERMICLEVKVQIGIIQQNRLRNSKNIDLNERESLIEFD